MNYEPLVKGKRASDGKWIIGDGFHAYDGPVKWITPLNESCAYEVNSETVCPYTGWTFNGQRAFVGDVLKSEYGISVVRYGKMRVEDYSFIGFYIEYENGECTLPDADCMDYWTVIGNIHDIKALVETIPTIEMFVRNLR